LPQVDVGSVPLGELIGRLVQQTYADVGNLSETFPNLSNVERKRQILKFADDARKQYVKLLAIVRWSKQAQEFQKISNLHAFLDRQDACFEQAANSLFMMHGDMKRAKVSNFDIPTAIDVLTTGKYQRMPSVIRKSMVPPAPLSPVEVKETLERLDDVIRMRLLCDEVLPLAMRKNMRIDQGCVTFTVKDEFELVLSLPGSDPTATWRVGDLKFLV
ncbi:mediator complex, subunit Med14, partial [Blyttiomyces helicus]